MELPDYTTHIETITLTVEKSVLEAADRAAEAQHTTRDELLNEWLTRLALGTERVKRYDELMERMSYVKAAGHTEDLQHGQQFGDLVIMNPLL